MAEFVRWVRFTATCLLLACGETAELTGESAQGGGAGSESASGGASGMGGEPGAAGVPVAAGAPSFGGAPMAGGAAGVGGISEAGASGAPMAGAGGQAGAAGGAGISSSGAPSAGGAGGAQTMTGGSAGSVATGGTGGAVACAWCGGASECEWCADADGDGYINPEACVTSCQPPGVVDGVQHYRRDTAHGDDCYDGNVWARPSLGAGHFFGEDRGDGSFDYDCDGDEVPEHETGSCNRLGVPSAVGWVDEVPPCGQSGAFVDFNVDRQCFLAESVAACR